MSAFIVLRHSKAGEGRGHTLIEVGRFDAKTGKSAVAQAAAKLGTSAHGEKLIAVPVKNWTELTVTVETNPRYRFE